jgi:glycosyltransferase involved in cell wall biosynthesis
MTARVPGVVHLTQRLSLGGAGRSLIAAAERSACDGRARHTVVSLLPPDPTAAALASAAGLTVLPGAALDRAAEAAEVLHIHFWNSPELYRALTVLPPARTVLTCHVGGVCAPQVLTEEVARLSDKVLVTAPHTLTVTDAWPELDTTLAPECVDFGRLGSVEPHPHEGFVVGYIGTVDFAKMHRDFVALHAGLGVAGLRLIVCGDGPALPVLRREAAIRGLTDRLDLRGHVENLGGALSGMDVFGYPLCEDTYATSELVLYEAAFAGVPAVVLDRGGAGSTVVNGVTGIVAADEASYREGIRRLARDPALRARMSSAARAHARACLTPAQLAPTVDAAYAKVMELPRRARRLAPPTSGASAFIRSLGNHAEPFARSAEGGAGAAEADAWIAQASPALAGPGSGGVLHYRFAYPDDAMLRYWAGLILRGQGRPALAAAELRFAEGRGVSRALPPLVGSDRGGATYQ